MPAYRHFILLLSTFAAVGSSVVHMDASFLVPPLQENGLGLSAAGLIAATPAAGIVFTLTVWGWFVDRYGEHATLFAGLTPTALMTGFAVLASSSGPTLLGATLLLSGYAAASMNSTPGRVVSGWYSPHQRDATMGIRQIAQFLDAALSAVALHPLAQNYNTGIALATSTILYAVLASLILVGVKNPPRPDVSSPTITASSYHSGKYLVRIHITLALLSWPQSTMGAHILVWLLSMGYTDGTAGTIMMVSQLLSAGSRVPMGAVPDQVRSHIRPYRWVSGAAFILAITMVIASWADWRTFGAVLVCALAVAMISPNGLAFTAVAEYTDPLQSGRAIGTQNTFQNTIYVATPPASGVTAAAVGFPALFAVMALFLAVALSIAPREDQDYRRRTGLG